LLLGHVSFAVLVPSSNPSMIPRTGPLLACAQQAGDLTVGLATQEERRRKQDACDENDHAPDRYSRTRS
jgi:hypothetical protein